MKAREKIDVIKLFVQKMLENVGPTSRTSKV